MSAVRAHAVHPASRYRLGGWSDAVPIEAPVGDVDVGFSDAVGWVSSKGCVYTSQPINAQTNANAKSKRARVKRIRVLSGRPRKRLIKVAHGKLFKRSPL